MTGVILAAFDLPCRQRSTRGALWQGAQQHYAASPSDRLDLHWPGRRVGGRPSDHLLPSGGLRAAGAAHPGHCQHPRHRLHRHPGHPDPRARSCHAHHGHPLRRCAAPRRRHGGVGGGPGPGLGLYPPPAALVQCPLQLRRLRSDGLWQRPDLPVDQRPPADPVGQHLQYPGCHGRGGLLLSGQHRAGLPGSGSARGADAGQLVDPHPAQRGHRVLYAHPPGHPGSPALRREPPAGPAGHRPGDHRLRRLPQEPGAARGAGPAHRHRRVGPPPAAGGPARRPGAEPGGHDHARQRGRPPRRLRSASGRPASWRTWNRSCAAPPEASGPFSTSCAP